jgi:hypothetical protein
MLEIPLLSFSFHAEFFMKNFFLCQSIKNKNNENAVREIIARCFYDAFLVSLIVSLSTATVQGLSNVIFPRLSRSVDKKFLR